MKLSQLTEKNYYKKNHVCKTPDSIYSTKISGKTISIKVELPFEANLTKDKSEKMEADLHYAIEKVLSTLFE